jgi:cobalt/nickel transport system permease protein
VASLFSGVFPRAPSVHGIPLAVIPFFLYDESEYSHTPVHIPDGFLDTKTVIATGLLSGVALGGALRHAQRTFPAQKVPLMGLTAAFVFAAQMVNFPVLAGTSGHLMGGVLSAVLLGPAGGVLVMTSVLIVQALFFADGGLLALGANVLNMALAAPLGGYAIYASLRRLLPGQRGTIVAVAFAAWCSTVLAAVLCAGELAWSGTAPWSAAFPAMANVHMLIGLGEGVITALVVAGLAKVRPELLGAGPEEGGRWVRVLYALVLILAFGIFVSPFASSWPDGLERVASALGFDQRGEAFAAPLADYQVPGVGSPAVATAVTAALGGIAVFLLSFLLARLLVPGPSRRS